VAQTIPSVLLPQMSDNPPNKSVSGFEHWLPKTTIPYNAAHGK